MSSRNANSFQCFSSLLFALVLEVEPQLLLQVAIVVATLSATGTLVARYQRQNVALCLLRVDRGISGDGVDVGHEV